MEEQPAYSVSFPILSYIPVFFNPFGNLLKIPAAVVPVPTREKAVGALTVHLLRAKTAAHRIRKCGKKRRQTPDDRTKAVPLPQKVSGRIMRRPQSFHIQVDDGAFRIAKSNITLE